MSYANEGHGWIGAALGGSPESCNEVSQIDELLTEHAGLLSQLSGEIALTRKRFDVVLLPESPKKEACANPVPCPARSALGYAIKKQSDLVRSMLSDLRSINDRSTV